MDPPPVCAINGNADLYGLGIRIGFYLQWYCTILADWLAPSEVPGLRKMNALLTTATFIALLILRRILVAPEIYVVLLLFFGSSYYILAAGGWRLIAYLKDNIDPSRHSASEPSGKTAILLWSLVLLAELSFTLWFWTVQVPTIETQTCQRYGFMFIRIRLNSFGFRVFHLVWASLSLVMILGLLVGKMNSKTPSKRQNGGSANTLRLLNSLSKLCIAVVVNVAVELSIAWNGIQGVNAIGSAGQLIPTVIGAWAVLQVVYVYLFGEGGDPFEDGFSLLDMRHRLKEVLNRPAMTTGRSSLPEVSRPMPVPRPATYRGDD